MSEEKREIDSEFIQVDGDVTSIIGQVMYKRIFGKKLGFASIKHENGTEISLVLYDTDLIKKINIGYTIKAIGKREWTREIPSLNPTKIEILKTCTYQTMCYDSLRVHKIEKIDELKALCKRWKTKGVCDIENCIFRHFHNKGEEEKFERLKIRQKEMWKESHEGDPIDEDSKMPKAARNLLYARWLVDKFGLEYLKSGEIIDVAGGKGLVSFYLTTEFGLKCVVVDPRGTTLPKRFRLQLQAKGLEIEERRSMFTVDFDEKLLKSAVLVFGMHPDEATEPIVDVAMKWNKNFAVVPCCVFPTLFKDRKLKNGDGVVLYHEFLTYLKEKIGDGVEMDHLKIEGKNKVLFRVTNQGF